MTVRQRLFWFQLLQFVLYSSVVMFALYQFKRNTSPQPIHFTKAENDLRAGRDGAARAEFDAALKQRPADPAAYSGVLQACMAANRPALEIEYARRALATLKQQPVELQSELYLVISEAYTQKEKPPHQEQAIEAAKHAVDLSPASCVMLNEYGYLLADNATGRGPNVDAALAALRKALDGIKSGNLGPGAEQMGPFPAAETEDSYGWALYKNEQYTDSLTALTQALGDYPDNAPSEVQKVSYYHLGMVYAKLGHKDQAANAFNSALAYDPKYEDALKAVASLEAPVYSAPSAGVAAGNDKSSSAIGPPTANPLTLDKKN